MIADCYTGREWELDCLLRSLDLKWEGGSFVVNRKTIDQPDRNSWIIYRGTFCQWDLVGESGCQAVWRKWSLFGPLEISRY